MGGGGTGDFGRDKLVPTTRTSANSFRKVALCRRFVGVTAAVLILLWNRHIRGGDRAQRPGQDRKINNQTIVERLSRPPKQNINQGRRGKWRGRQTDKRLRTKFAMFPPTWRRAERTPELPKIRPRAPSHTSTITTAGSQCSPEHLKASRRRSSRSKTFADEPRCVFEAKTMKT